MRKKIMIYILMAVGTLFLLTGCKKNVGTPEDNAVGEKDAGESNGMSSSASGKGRTDHGETVYRYVGYVR